MKLGEALAQLKKEKSRLARLISIRKENVYVEKGKKTPFDPREVGKKINEKIEEIRELKIKIQKTNLSTKIPEQDISLAEAIISIGDIRSQMANLRTLFEDKREYSWRLRDKDTIEKIPQLNEKEIEEEMESLETEKIRIDNLIQVTNWETELVN